MIPIDQRGNWVNMQVWARENTPQDAIFLTPPYLEAFRVYSERSIVADTKDGTQQYFDINYSYKWWERITDLGWSSAEYDNLSPERLIQLGKKYNASYLVFPAAKPLPFPQVYENSEFRLYDLTRVSEEAGEPESQ